MSRKEVVRPGLIKAPVAGQFRNRQVAAGLHLSVKRPLDTLDVVVVGAEWGHGKRRAVLSDLTFAVRDEDTGRLVTIGTCALCAFARTGSHRARARSPT